MFTTNVHCIYHFHVCFWSEGIVITGSINCDFSYSVKIFEQNFIIFLDSFPLSFVHSVFLSWFHVVLLSSGFVFASRIAGLLSFIHSFSLVVNVSESEAK